MSDPLQRALPNERLKAALDHQVEPVTLDEVRERLLRGADSSLRRRPGRRRVTVRTTVAGFVVGVVVVALAVVLAPRSTTPALGVLVPTGSGPCTGAAPGCRSTSSTAAALASGRWSTFPSGPLAPRGGEVEVWTGRELIVWGGSSSRSGVPESDGAAYDPVDQTWRLIAPSPLSAREGAAAVWTGSEMIVVGGDNGKVVFDDAAAYDPATNSWRSLPSLPIAARTSATAIWTGKQLVVIGGGSSAATRLPLLDDAAAYDPTDNEWATLPAIPRPAGWQLDSLRAVWTGRALFTWLSLLKFTSCGAGCSSGDAETPGYSLAAEARSWQQVTESPSGSLRVYGDVVWTGSTVLATGVAEECAGTCPFSFDYLFSYDPATGAWTKVPNWEAEDTWPVVWTGRALILTGRVLPDNPLSYRGPPIPFGQHAYDQGSGTWAFIPAPRAALNEGADAIWTGTQLLIWGWPSKALTAGPASP